MKSLLCLLIALSTLVLGSAKLLAVEADATTPHASKDAEPETELTKKMDKMNSAFRKLRRQVTDATKNADSLEQVVILREFAKDSAKLDPAKAATIPAADREKWLAKYQAKMKELLITIDQLEAALKAGHNEEAGKIVAELNAQQRAGHKEFRTDTKK